VTSSTTFLSTPTVSALLVRAQLLAALAAGVDIAALAARAECPDPFGNERTRIPIDAFARLVRLTWDTLGSESGGFTEQPQRRGLFNMMCHATITCPNLRRALLRGARFYALVQDELRIELAERGDEALLGFQHANRRGLDDRGFTESLMVIWLRWASWLIGREILADRILFAGEPGDYPDEYPHMFPCDHRFGAGRNGIVFPARYLDAPLLRTPAELADLLASAPESLMRRYIEAPSVASSVRRLLRRHADLAQLTLEDVAQSLDMSSQTLRRRLREEGNGFQEIKDSVRKESAIELLIDGTRPINDIAVVLGFSEPSAFHRAFKKWTGLTPGAYREGSAR
jgi:AraC-like DNA-binding protein